MNHLLPRLRHAGAAAGAAAVGAALCSLALGATPGPAQAADPSWQRAYQPTLGSGGQFTSVAVTSRGNAWAVGVRNTGNGLIAAHWDGSAWQASYPAGAKSFSAAVYPQVASSGARNVWVFGAKTSGAGAAVRWNGSRWQSVALPGGVPVSAPVVLGTTSVWVAGDQYLTSHGGSTSCKTKLWHWNGSRWSSSQVGFCVTALGGTAGNNVWATGTETLPGKTGKAVLTAARWNGSAWRMPSMPHPDVYRWFPDVAVGSPGNVWIGADKADPSNANQPGSGWALHWTGRAWVRSAVSPLATAAGLATDGAGGAWMGPEGNGPGRPGWTRRLTPRPSLAPPRTSPTWPASRGPRRCGRLAN